MRYAVIMLLLIGFQANAQFIQNSSQSLFSDVKAFTVGDALTVLITEDFQANGNSSMQNGRESNVGFDANMGVNALGSLRGEAGAGHSNNFKGGGSTSRNERIRTQLSVRVIGVEANGNMQIEGKRTTKINGETQTIIIRGVVRLVDILPDNSLYSYSILDLTLLIEGDGQISEVQEPGLITKFIRFLF